MLNGTWVADVCWPRNPAVSMIRSQITRRDCRWQRQFRGRSKELDWPQIERALGLESNVL